jgi:hypothetical protein
MKTPRRANWALLVLASAWPASACDRAPGSATYEVVEAYEADQHVAPEESADEATGPVELAEVGMDEPGPELAESVEGVDACAPACDGRNCGANGCGGLCGKCDEGAACDEGVCLTVCAADSHCTDREACANWGQATAGRCAEVCTDGCPPGLGLQLHDGCHCRVAPSSSRERAQSMAYNCWDEAEDVDQWAGLPQLTDQGNGTVLDLRTGLTWAKAALPDSTSQSAAQSACAALPLPGESWRLPTPQEALSLAVCEAMWGDETCLPQVHALFDYPCGASACSFWTAGLPYPDRGVTVSYWPVGLALADPTRNHHGLCVRGGAGSPVPGRFLSLVDGSVADRVTGLAWSGTMCVGCTGGEATSSCDLAGPGWRIPTLKEWLSVLAFEPQQPDCPFLPPQLTDDCPTDGFWAVQPRGGWASINALVQPDPLSDFLVGVDWPGNARANARCVRALADGDGVPSGLDNCLGLPNPDQLDHDGNGLGEPCDPADQIVECPPDEPCAARECGLVIASGVFQCGWCPEGQVCRAGVCEDVVCDTDADCWSEEEVLPGGTVPRCDPLTHACAWGMDDDSEVLDVLQRMYRGAVLAYSHQDRLDKEGEPLPCQMPTSQGITPLELTCCNVLGGPDADKDQLCDADPDVWTQPTWSSLGMVMPEPHAFVYNFNVWPPGLPSQTLFMANAFGDLDCDGSQDTFAVLGRPAAQPCTLLTPETLAFRWPYGSVVGKPWSQTPALEGTIPLTPEQQAGFLPPAGQESVNPFWDEVSANLGAILDGAVEYYEDQPAGTCAFPGDQEITPESLTCCYGLGGADADLDDLCDADPSIWDAPTWNAVGFSILGDHKYAYKLLNQAVGQGVKEVRAYAYGDVDCDGSQSTFVRFARGIPGPGCDAQVIPGVYVENENE